jgi:hypothetical protein
VFFGMLKLVTLLGGNRVIKQFYDLFGTLAHG